MSKKNLENELFLQVFYQTHIDSRKIEFFKKKTINFNQNQQGPKNGFHYICKGLKQNSVQGIQTFIRIFYKENYHIKHNLTN